MTVSEALRLIREGAYTAIIAALAVVVCSIAVTMILQARDRRQTRRRLLEREKAEYWRELERKGKA